MPDDSRKTPERVNLTAIDIPFEFWIDIAFKVVFAFLIVAVVLGIPIGIVVALILRAT